MGGGFPTTPLIWTSIALGSLIVGVALQRFIQLVNIRGAQDADEGESTKPMTYAEAMSALTKVEPALRRRRRKKKARAEPVALSALRYGEYHTDTSKLRIEAWRPEPSHRLAGHVVVDIIPKEATSTSSVRRLAIDLETVEATRLVELKDGSAVVMAVRDYEVKGQGIIFKDLDYSRGVGVDETTLYVVLVVKHGGPQTDAFTRLARGLAAATTAIDLEQQNANALDVVQSSAAAAAAAATQKNSQQPPPTSAAAKDDHQTISLGDNDDDQEDDDKSKPAAAAAAAAPASPPSDVLARPDVDVAAFFASEFTTAFD